MRRFWQPRPGSAAGPLATEDDLHACYHLLLEREPDPDGLTTFRRLLASRPVAVRQLVRLFLDSTEFRLRQKRGSLRRGNRAG